MDITTVAGLLIGWAFVIYGIQFQNLYMFWNFPSILITVGGTISALIISYNIKSLKNIAKVVKKAFFTDNLMEARKLIDIMVSFAVKARSDGLLALEDDLEELEDEFLKKGIQMVVDGIEPETVSKILKTEMEHLMDRHEKNKGVFDNAASFAPAYGMIGTLIGLIIMLRNLEDISTIGSGMAVALITTLYGSILANLIFTPLALKLEEKHREEMVIKEMMLEGILSIQAGDNPRMIEENLRSFLAPSDRFIESGEEEEEEE
jgi:chemotaxis protein MotA